MHVYMHTLGKHWMVWREEEGVEERSSVQCEGRVLKEEKEREKERGREKMNEKKIIKLVIIPFSPHLQYNKRDLT